MKKITDLHQATSSQLSDFIYNCLGTRSEKTGKYIHINTYHWNKQQLLNLIMDSGYTLTAIQYINGENIF